MAKDDENCWRMWWFSRFFRQLVFRERDALRSGMTMFRVPGWFCAAAIELRFFKLKTEAFGTGPIPRASLRD
jgi:hypothetical protein